MNRRDFFEFIAGLAAVGLTPETLQSDGGSFRLRYIVASSMHGRMSLADVLQEIGKAGAKYVGYKGWIEVFMHPVPRGIPILPTAAQVTAQINLARAYLETCLRGPPRKTWWSVWGKQYALDSKMQLMFHR